MRTAPVPRGRTPGRPCRPRAVGGGPRRDRRACRARGRCRPPSGRPARAVRPRRPRRGARRGRRSIGRRRWAPRPPCGSLPGARRRPGRRSGPARARRRPGRRGRRRAAAAASSRSSHPRIGPPSRAQASGRRPHAQVLWTPSTKPGRLSMNRNKTARPPRQDRAWVSAAEWFAGGQRIPYDPGSARTLTEEQAAATPSALRVFERVAGAGHDPDRVWLTLLPGFPDGSYGWAQVDRILGDGLRPRLYVEPVGQGDSDKPRRYRYSTVERADLVQALWRHHGVRATVVVTFDYTSLALLELLRRQLERATSRDPEGPVITAAFMINGGLFADSHTHPWRTTPLLRTPLGALGMRRAQRSPRVFDATIVQARLYSRGYHPAPAERAELRSAITRRDGAVFLHSAAGFVAEHRRHADRWDLAAIARDIAGTVAFYVGGSDEDPYEHRQIPATRRRVPQAEVVTFPGGHLTTSEHPDLLAAAIRGIAARHGVGTPATTHR